MLLMIFYIQWIIAKFSNMMGMEPMRLVSCQDYVRLPQFFVTFMKKVEDIIDILERPIFHTFHLSRARWEN